MASVTKAEIVAAIRRAAAELGRAPSRGELKRMAGVSHYRVLTVFRSLREAVRAAGLEPSRKGRPVSTEELVRDWERVRKKLGRRPSRAEYVREGKYSAGTFVGRFGAWGKVGNTYHGDTEAPKRSGTKIARIAKTAKESKLKTIAHPPFAAGGRIVRERGKMAAKERSFDSPRQASESGPSPRKSGAVRGTPLRISPADSHPTTRKSRALPSQIAQKRRNPGALVLGTPANARKTAQDGAPTAWQSFDGDKAIAFAWARSLAAIPAPLEGKRRVTEAIAAMVVNTLIPSTQQSALSTQSLHHAQNRRVLGAPIQSRTGMANGRSSLGKLRKDRPVMGPPFSRHPLTNAPVNEMGVVFLFALVAWELGFQVESLWTRGEPDGRAKRQVAPGKWQDVGVEFEYESRNFLRHGHDPKRCDVIVCWRHNWKECPDNIEVIELCRLFE